MDDYTEQGVISNVEYYNQMLQNKIEEAQKLADEMIKYQNILRELVERKKN